MDLETLLSDVAMNVSNELKLNPDIDDVEFPLDLTSLPIAARKWVRLDEIFVVYADLKASTSLGTGKHAASTAAIFQAGTGSLIDIFDEFDADFVQIQGDGAFAIFWDHRSFERAICAAITVRTFSADFTEKLTAKWPDAPKTGFKVGVSAGRVLVKRVGKVARPDWQEPVWAGKPVNYAVKAAQCGDIDDMIVTGSVWDRIEVNDYLAASCPCGVGETAGVSTTLWSDFEIEKLPADDPERFGRVLHSKWCAVHGAVYCAAVLEGGAERDDVANIRSVIRASQYEESFRKVAAEKRRTLAARRKGLRK